LGLTGAQGHDLVIVSDVDEIISRNKLTDAIEQRRPSELTVFEMPIYRFYVNRKALDRPCLLGPRMIDYAKFRSAQKLRMTKPFVSKTLGASLLGRLHTKVWNSLNCGIWADVRIVENAGWHFTSIGDWKQWRSKVDAYSHAERKELPTYKSEEAFGRFIEEKTQAADLGELPKMIQEQRENFQFFE
jgi:beta-1,4-mannosyl-glycoprotein beta-1,4-N-acetylglucosaminyltransferase